jgi:hypothetical protein
MKKLLLILTLLFSGSTLAGHNSELPLPACSSLKPIYAQYIAFYTVGVKAYQYMALSQVRDGLCYMAYFSDYDTIGYGRFEEVPDWYYAKIIYEGEIYYTIVNDAHLEEAEKFINDQVDI